jgi:SAM-dependent methyltransferase
MRYDPTIYQGSAAYYAQGRPPYSRALVATLATEVGLDGTGRLLDVGCGPGILTLALADRFSETIGLDPDPEMLVEGKRRAMQDGINTIRWVQGLAEDLQKFSIGRFKLVTFGQSFHWTDRERVAEMVYDMLDPGGTLAVITHEHADSPRPASPGYPPIPHTTIRALIDQYLGPRQRAGQGFVAPPSERNEDALARTRFGVPQYIFCPGRPDIVRDIDGVLAGYFSMSFAAPHLFGDQLERFEAEASAELVAQSPSGRFWDWPGDTKILLARKPGA